MVNICTNINKTNNRVSPQLIIFNKDHDILRCRCEASKKIIDNLDRFSFQRHNNIHFCILFSSNLQLHT